MSGHRASLLECVAPEQHAAEAVHLETWIHGRYKREDTVQGWWGVEDEEEMEEVEVEKVLEALPEANSLSADHRQHARHGNADLRLTN